jgi:hypothetical protein
MIRATTLTGTRDEVLEAVRRMSAAGINQVVVQPVTEMGETLQSFAKEIIRRLSRE